MYLYFIGIFLFCLIIVYFAYKKEPKTIVILSGYAGSGKDTAYEEYFKNTKDMLLLMF